MSNMPRLLFWINQWLQPRAFRIVPRRPMDPEAAVVALLRSLDDAARASEAATEERGRGDGLDATLIVGICNAAFRLRGALQELSAQSESRITRRIGRTLRDLDELLEDSGIEYADLEDRLFDPRSREFRTDVAAVPDASVQETRIGPCELPLVRFNGQVLQQAVGIVLRPK